MTMLKVLLLFGAVSQLTAVPIVLKESSPNGESVISVSSSDPEVEKYLLDYATKRGAKQDQTVVSQGGYNPGTVVQSFSISTPEKNIAGTGRSFGDSPNPPFLLSFLNGQNLQGFDLSNWFRNIEPFYESSYPQNSVGGARATSAVVNNNGHVGVYSSARSVRHANTFGR